MDRWLKIAGALLLLASLALPMGSCTRHEDEKGNPVEVAKGAPVPAGTREVVTYDYALDDFDLKEAGWWVRLLAFAWPAVFAGLFAWRKRGRVVVALRLLEPVLVAGSLYLVVLLSSAAVERRESGAYLAFCALGIYGLASLWEDAVAWRSWRRERRA